MIWQQKTQRPLEIIARTGFLVSVVSYIVFWLAELVQPGFVSRFFSMHIFFLAALVFGGLWSKTVQEYTSRPRLQLLVGLLCGALMAVLIWNLSGDLGGYQFPVSCIAFLTPPTVFFLIRS